MFLIVLGSIMVIMVYVIYIFFNVIVEGVFWGDLRVCWDVVCFLNYLFFDSMVLYCIVFGICVEVVVIFFFIFEDFW